MKKNIVFIFIISLQLCFASRGVVLLHGINGKAEEMAALARYLAPHYEAVLNFHYPSTTAPIAELSQNYIAPALQQLAAETDTVDVVAHSMGCIMIRYFLAHHPAYPIGSIVMIGPPNHGSQLTDFFGSWKLYKRRYGPAGDQIGTKSIMQLNLPESCPAPTGIIAGTKTMLFVYSMILPGADDGKVTHASMRLSGMQDFITLPHHHDEICQKSDTAAQVLHFLQNGMFQRKLINTD
jgi:pimeloyl-ACP methyl ester carboxylesterase